MIEKSPVLGNTHLTPRATEKGFYILMYLLKYERQKVPPVFSFDPQLLMPTYANIVIQCIAIGALLHYPNV
jgi:hypothetical protein